VSLADELALRYPIPYDVVREFVALAEAAGNLELARLLCDMVVADLDVKAVVKFLLREPAVAARYWAGVAERAVGAR